MKTIGTVIEAAMLAFPEFKSKSEVRRMIKQCGIRINDVVVFEDEADALIVLDGNDTYLWKRK